MVSGICLLSRSNEITGNPRRLDQKEQRKFSWFYIPVSIRTKRYVNIKTLLYCDVTFSKKKLGEIL